MVFFNQPSTGPDAVGGVWPWTHIAKVRNRTGRTILKGAVLQLALTPGEATEISTNDSNSYVPGASNDTVFNTIIDPRSNATNGSSVQRGGIFCIALSPETLDEGILDAQFFGVVSQAFVIKAGADHIGPGDPLTIAVNATNCVLDGVITSNEVVIATYLADQTNLTSRRLRRVLLHQGLFSQTRGQSGGFG